MSIGRYSSQKLLSVREHAMHHRAMHVAMSRRRFLQAATGASAIGAALGESLLVPRTAEAGPGVGDVLPIPSTLNFFGTDVHVQAPPMTGVDTDPSTVWNFQGYSGIAFIDTKAAQRDRKTGNVQGNLESTSNHMTFMQGVFQGRDGHVRAGTFSLV